MKELTLTVDEAVNYLKENVKIHDNLEISYNRIFAEGEVLNMDFLSILVSLALRC